MANPDPQCARAVMMVRPAAFGFNSQTAASNVFQQFEEAPAQAAALEEFAALVRKLREAGVEVIVADDTPDPCKPDAIFPNNWVSFHRDGSVVLYPMSTPNRRSERREDLIEHVGREARAQVRRIVDLSHREATERYLEGTGSVVLDRVHRIAYAGLSPRTDLDVLGEFCQRLDYEAVAFEATDENGCAVYHTNVVMTVGERFAVVCAEAIEDPARRRQVLDRLAATGRETVPISRAQMRSFAANCLQLDAPGGPVIVISSTALAALEDRQRETLARHGRLIRAEVPTIERVGGGGVRCMLAEIHLPARA
ncbi:MAG: amidinotransferase [Gammaproteobacteria bacterium]|nr:amidinotransferase [Gammaproteobacteria bacterium]